jgi:hypothetical protein
VPERQPGGLVGALDGADANGGLHALWAGQTPASSKEATATRRALATDLRNALMRSSSCIVCAVK